MPQETIVVAPAVKALPFPMVDVWICLLLFVVCGAFGVSSLMNGQGLLTRRSTIGAFMRPGGVSLALYLFMFYQFSMNQGACFGVAILAALGGNEFVSFVLALGRAGLTAFVKTKVPGLEAPEEKKD